MFIVPALITLYQAIVLGSFGFWQDTIFPEKMGWVLYFISIAYGLANITFSMALSSFFADAKFAN